MTPLITADAVLEWLERNWNILTSHEGRVIISYRRGGRIQTQSGETIAIVVQKILEGERSESKHSDV